ncbi:hypothetical protein Tco_0140556 [Tanacetum coccineum]
MDSESAHMVAASNVLMLKPGIVQKEKGGIQFNVEKLENASKSLNKIIESKIVDNCKKGLGYNAVPPPLIGNFMPLKHDLSGLEEFVNEPIVNEPTVKKSVVETSEVKASADKICLLRRIMVRPKLLRIGCLIWEEEDMPQAKKEEKIVKSSFAKIRFVKSKEQVKSPRKTTVKQGNKNRKSTHSPRGNQKMEYMMSQRLGSNFEMINKACYRVNVVSDKNVNTARPKALVNTAKPKAVLNAVKGNQINVIKASACWVWKPKTKVLGPCSKTYSASPIHSEKGNPQMDLQDQGMIDIGCSRHMTRNMSYLIDFEEINGGYVAFGGNPKRGIITSRENLIDQRVKLLDEIWADKVRLDGMIKLKEEKAMAKMKGQMLKEKKDPGAFIFPIMLEGRINENALADIGSDTNTMSYRIYEQLVGFTTLSAKFLILEIHVDRDAPIVVGHGFLDTIGGNIDIPNRIFTTFDGRTRQTFRAAKSEKIRIAESDSDDEEDYVIKRNDMGTPIHNSRPIGYQNNTNPAENMTLSTLESVINPFRKSAFFFDTADGNEYNGGSIKEDIPTSKESVDRHEAPSTDD